MKPRDLPYESLAEATGTDQTAGRGELNAALKSIRQQSTLTGQLLAGEIQVRARQYRQLMPDVVLTPNALAKHWHRVNVEAARSTGTNLHSDARCATCEGDRFVPVGTTSIETNFGRSLEVDQYAPCPDCGPADVHWWRPDGTRAACPDPAQVRELMTR
jgi:hypothetical protein